MHAKRILVTGASGFIGFSLFSKLKEQGHIVLGGAFSCANLVNGMTYFPLQDVKAMKEILSQFQPDCVVHTAAIASVMHADVSQIYAVNAIGSENLLNAIADTCSSETTVLLLSTAGVYGNQPVEYLSEDLPFHPANHYSYSKMVMEMISQQFMDRLNIKIIRPFNIIGKSQLEKFLLPKIVKHYAIKAPLIKLGNLGAIRDYVNLNQCIDILIHLIHAQESFLGPINICNGQGYSGNDVLAILSKITGHYPEIEKNDAFVRRDEVWRLVGSTQRLRTIVGEKFTPIPIEETLLEIYNFFVEKESRAVMA